MKSAILKYIAENPGTLFSELERNIEGFKGETNLCSGGIPNVVLWMSISREAAAAVGELVQNDEVVLQPAEKLDYAIDADRLPQLPIAERPPVGGYKEPHWLPVKLSLPA